MRSDTLNQPNYEWNDGVEVFSLDFHISKLTKKMFYKDQCFYKVNVATFIYYNKTYRERVSFYIELITDEKKVNTVMTKSFLYTLTLYV